MSGLSARFGGRVGDFALDVAFDLPDQSVTGLFGPSGAGKTLVLRCLAGLERMSGALTLNGELWQGETRFVPTGSRRIGFVFQGANLLSHLSVRANLAYAAKRAAQPDRSIDALIERTGISGLLDRMPDRLSGGEAQRVAITRALIVQPRLLLLDEPLSALDAGAKAGLLDLLAEMLPEIGVTTLYVSHDPAEIAILADRRIVLDHGRVAAIEPTDRRLGSRAPR